MAQTNRERIIQVLKSHADGLCDDCLSRISSVTPRQTVYAICSVVAPEGLISRVKRECPQCQKTKLVNALKGSPPPPYPAPPKKLLPSPPPALPEQTDVLSNYLHEMTQMLRRIDPSAPPNEPFAAWVTRLRRTGVLPRTTADMMHTINAMRVQVVKDRSALLADEWAAVQANWKVLDRWRKGLSV